MMTTPTKPLIKLKTAIICDWLVTPGGAEKVLAEIIHCFPHADLFAVIDFLQASVKTNLLKPLHNKTITTTFIQKLPFAKKYYRHYLPLMPLAIEQLDVSAYDLILSSSHAVAKGVLTGPNQIHICYTHSPMRYVWDLQHQYLQETGLNKKWRGYIVRYLLHKLRLWDARSANNVDHFIANSHYIARRIAKTYRRDATVIYPPIELPRFTPMTQKENFYLTASRLVPYKKIDLIVESFQHFPDKKLIVIGDGPEFNKIKNKAGKNVEILGYQADDVLLSYMQRARAFIFAAEEDFGLLPLEAQACGTPVIAFGKGGACETVRDLTHPHPTGVFFATQTIAALGDAIQLFEANQATFTADNCVANAAQFSQEKFQTALKAFVDAVVV